jgi:hypothetical protein
LVKSGALVEIVILKRYPWSDPKRGARQVTAEIVDKWFSYRNEDLWDRMPAWMSDGITRFLASADMRGRRLRFQPDVDEKTALNQAFVMDRNLEKKGQPAQNIQPLEKLVRMTRREQWQGAGWSGRFFPYQCGSFVRFLFTGPGARMKQTKGIIQTYVEELTRELEEVQKRIEAERKERAKRRKAMAGMSEEERLKAEDEEYRRRRKEALDSQQKRMLENVYEKTFGRLSDREWQYVQKYWEKFAGK